jgi:PAS domain S-box-containing protein
MLPRTDSSVEDRVARSASALLSEHERVVHVGTDLLFARLMALQWIAGVVVAVIVSPHAWVGAHSEVHLHIWTAVLVGGCISALPIALAWTRPGRLSTRYVIASGQMLTSALLIHLCGGRIETHFHVFVSLAFLAAYRDWRVLVPATAVITADHMLRGIYWPQSVFGVIAASQWRWVEHACWVLFEDWVLVLSCLRGAAEMRHIALRRAQLEATNEFIEAKVHDQTREIREREEVLHSVTSASPIAVFRTSGTTQQLDYVNAKCERILGRSAAELLRDGWSGLVSPADRLACDAAMASGVEFEQELVVYRPDDTERCVHLRAAPLDGGRRGWVGTIEDVTERKAAEEERARLAQAVEQAGEAILITDIDGRISYVNPAFERMTGFTREEAVGNTPRIMKSGKHDADFYRRLWETIMRGEIWSGEITNRKKDGSTFQIAATLSSVRDETGQITHFVEVMRDMTERRSLEAQLQHAQRLESVGQLAAGVAHEINTPTQYVGDNTRFLADSFRDLQEPLAQLNAMFGEGAGPPSEREIAALAEAVRAIDVPYLLEEVPRALSQTLDGIERVSNIVRSMKEFTHPAHDAQPNDLNRLITTTVTVSRNEWKYVAEVETDLDPELGSVPCVAGEISQVILNIVVNAAHAIGDVVADQPGKKGKIRISTARAGEWIELRIADTGKGMPAEVRSRIFDPFFTTKPVGKGTGQGLTIAHKIVTAHKGTIAVESRVGEGTTFVIRLPAAHEEILT